MSTESRERILAEAERLFGQHGFAATRLASIATAAGLGNAGLLHHYRSKATLYRAVLDQIATDLSTRYRLDEDSIDEVAQLTELIDGLLALNRDRPSAMAIIGYEFLDKSGRIDEAGFLPLAQVVEDTVALLQSGQLSGSIRPGDPLAMTAALHGSLIIGSIGRNVYRRTGGDEASEDWEAELAKSALASVVI